MKTAVETIDVTSTIDNETQFTINTANSHILMDMLSKLYNNPHKIVLQEYAANALDAHIEAGVTRPIEVTLPNALNPQITVRDFGKGMSPDTVSDVLTTYLLSTKNTTNDVIGGYGIGVKSAFAITDMFSVTTIHDGIKYEYLMSLNDRKEPVYTLLEKTASQEPSGTTITVPVQNNDQIYWEKYAQQIFCTWTTGTIQLNGTVLTCALDDEPMYGNVHFVNCHTNNRMGTIINKRPVDQCIVVVGGINYLYNINDMISTKTVDDNHPIFTMFRDRYLGYDSVPVINLQPGDVKVHYNREIIEVNQKNSDILAQHLINAILVLIKQALDEYKAINSIYDAVDFYEKYDENRGRLSIPGAATSTHGTIAHERLCKLLSEKYNITEEEYRSLGQSKKMFFTNRRHSDVLAYSEEIGKTNRGDTYFYDKGWYIYSGNCKKHTHNTIKERLHHYVNDYVFVTGYSEAEHRATIQRYATKWRNANGYKALVFLESADNIVHDRYVGANASDVFTILTIDEWLDAVQPKKRKGTVKKKLYSNKHYGVTTAEPAEQIKYSKYGYQTTVLTGKQLRERTFDPQKTFLYVTHSTNVADQIYPGFISTGYTIISFNPERNSLGEIEELIGFQPPELTRDRAQELANQEKASITEEDLMLYKEHYIREHLWSPKLCEIIKNSTDLKVKAYCFPSQKKRNLSPEKTHLIKHYYSHLFSSEYNRTRALQSEHAYSLTYSGSPELRLINALLLKNKWNNAVLYTVLDELQEHCVEEIEALYRKHLRRQRAARKAAQETAH